MRSALLGTRSTSSPPRLFSRMYSRVPLLRCRYRAHLSREQVAEVVAPHPDTLKLVHAWLEYRGVPSSSVSVTHGGSSLKLTGVSVSKAEDLLSASYQLYRHVKTNETIVRTLGYALPAVLDVHVQMVAPTTSFDSPRKHWQKPRKLFGRGAAVELKEGAPGEPVTVPSSRDDNVATTPSFLRWGYNTWAYSPAATDQNMLGIVGYLGQYPGTTDLDLFMSNYRSNAAGADFSVLQVNNGQYDPSHPGAGANIDMQYAQGIAYPTPHIFYSTGRGLSGTDDWYLSWLEYILDEPIIPQTISVPYGNDEKLYTRGYAGYVCYLFARLGLRGVSVLFPSGDNGVGLGTCRDRFGNVRFIPSFPASCTCGLFFLARKQYTNLGMGHSPQPQVPGSLLLAEQWAT
jgi:tripeptidyl-peptidase-1